MKMGSSIDSRGVVYLDYHASTPCDPRVVEAMLPHLLGNPANASSEAHALGKDARRAVEEARSALASFLGAKRQCVIFTSGATESNNLAILGSARVAPPHRRRVLISAIEHKCVLGTGVELQRLGFDVKIIPVLSDGTIDLSALVGMVDESTWLVSVQAASNEIGTIQPVEEISQLVHHAGALFHCDAAQAAGRVSIDVEQWDVDFLSLSSHKMYGPKGVGALYLRGGPGKAPIDPLFFGGGQESGIRPGTLNVPGIAGAGRACEIANDEAEAEQLYIAQLRNAFEVRLRGLNGIVVNGNLSRRLAGNSSLTFADVDAEALIANVPLIAISTGSACASGAPEPSHVLTAVGLSRSQAYQTIRVGLGRFTTATEIEIAAEAILRAVRRIRRLPAESPLVYA